MAQQILKRRGTAAQWTAANTLLAAGEEGFETDTKKSKVGDGTTLWNALAYLPTGTVSDATSSANGAVRLAGDLAGTAAAPTVAKVNGVAVSGTPSAGQVLTAGSSSAAAWSTPASGAGDASTGSKGVVQLAGDLAGTAAAPVVSKVNGVAISGTPTSGQVLQATSSSAAAWAAAPSGGVTGTGGSPVTTTSAIASDAAMSGTYAQRSADYVDGRAYLAGDLVTYSGTIYRITTGYTSSGGALDLTKATAVGGSGGSSSGPGTDVWLKNPGNWAVKTVATTDSTTGLALTGTVIWTDGLEGAFTFTVTSGDYSAWTVTWVDGGTTKTVTATGITYDANGNRLGPTSVAVTSGGAATAPGAPTNVVATAGSQMSVTWTLGPDGGSALSSQKIQVSSNSGATWVDALTVSASATSATITSGLTQGASYVVRVQATNAVGTTSSAASAAATAGASSSVYSSDALTGSGSLGTDSQGHTWNMPNTVAYTRSSSGAYPTAGTGGTYSATQDDGQTNGVFVVSHSSQAAAAWGIVIAGSADNTTGYLCWNNGGTNLQISKRTGPSTFGTPLATATCAYSSGAELRVTKSGNTITATYNGVTVTATDATYSGTQSGVYTYGTGAGRFTGWSHTSS